jgi:hypothetical protein
MFGSAPLVGGLALQIEGIDLAGHAQALHSP